MSERRLPPHAWRRFALGVVALTTYGVGCQFGAHYLMSWLWTHFGADPAAPVRVLVASFVGFVLMAIPPTIFGLLHRPKEIRALQALIAAIGRLAKGDFRARVMVDGLRGGGIQHPFLQVAHEINDMAEQLDRLERLRQEFISDVSHELQSPLTSIGGFAKALRDDALPVDDRHRYLDIIALEAERLSRLGDNLLRLTALEGDAPNVRLASYRLDTQLKRVVLAAEPQWSAKDLEVEASVEPLTLVADEALLDHVWSNLLHNAIKFTPDGGSITVRLARRGDEAVVEVVDTGIGIAEEDQSRVFERFFKADRSRNRDAGGSGLGLALVRKIVTLHGGRIGVTSAPERGATFAVTLALAGPTSPELAPRG